MDGKRTEQHCGNAGDADVEIFNLPDFHIESKGTKGSKLSKSTLLKWHEQIKNDCPHNKIPFIQFTANGKEPLILITTETLQELRLDPKALFPGLICVDESIEPHKELLRQRKILQVQRKCLGDIPFKDPWGIFFRLNDEDIFYINDADVLAKSIINHQTFLNSLPPAPEPPLHALKASQDHSSNTQPDPHRPDPQPS